MNKIEKSIYPEGPQGPEGPVDYAIGANGPSGPPPTLRSSYYENKSYLWGVISGHAEKLLALGISPEEIEEEFQEQLKLLKAKELMNS